MSVLVICSVSASSRVVGLGWGVCGQICYSRYWNAMAVSIFGEGVVVILFTFP